VIASDRGRGCPKSDNQTSGLERVQYRSGHEKFCPQTGLRATVLRLARYAKTGLERASFRGSRRQAGSNRINENPGSKRRGWECAYPNGTGAALTRGISLSGLILGFAFLGCSLARAHVDAEKLNVTQLGTYSRQLATSMRSHSRCPTLRFQAKANITLCERL
jgi:hypothetical protein